MTGHSSTGRILLDLMVVAPRGPRRDGLFAVWLTVRVLEDLDADHPFPERATRRRIAMLERRLSSLTLPLSLKRGLAATIGTLNGEIRPDEVGQLLSRLTGPVKDGLGLEAAEAVQKAARAHR